ncbi:hypothetical protein BDV11DRAFT_188198 [Aspergillus similis]
MAADRHGAGESTPSLVEGKKKTTRMTKEKRLRKIRKSTAAAGGTPDTAAPGTTWHGLTNTSQLQDRNLHQSTSAAFAAAEGLASRSFFFFCSLRSFFLYNSVRESGFSARSEREFPLRVGVSQQDGYFLACSGWIQLSLCRMIGHVSLSFPSPRATFLLPLCNRAAVSACPPTQSKTLRRLIKRDSTDLPSSLHWKRKQVSDSDDACN